MEWEDVFANHLSENRLISKICKEFLKFTTKDKTKQPEYKMGKGIKRYLSKEDMHVANKHMKNCIQHH